ncbi:MAG TPA: InlB B-repeat-containing protein, partial [Acidimicrobiales bacterium]
MKNSMLRKMRFMSRLFTVMVIAAVAFSVSISASANAFPVVHDVTFMENAHSADSMSTYQMGSGATALTLFAQLSPSFANAGHSFNGWNTQPDGLGTSYTDGQTFAFDAELTLYAQWTTIQTVHTVSFYENSSSSDTVGTYLVDSIPTALTLFAQLSPSFANAGHSFNGWNTQP